MENNKNIDYITGQGLVFPILIENGSVKPKAGWELIKSCIHNILAFELGRRYFQRDFGVGIESLLEEPNDIVTQALLEHRLNTQLPKWDSRILVEDIEINRDLPNSLDILITLRLSGTNQREIITYSTNQQQ